MNYKFEITKMTYHDVMSLFRYGPQILTKIVDKMQRVAVDLSERDLCGNMDGDQNDGKMLTLFEEHRNQGFRWCKEFLCGSWSDITENDFVFTKLGGGLTNLLYTCELSDNVSTESEEPRRVLLRVYGDIGRDLKMLVKNSVVFCLLSEKQLGPKCYGLYPDGRIEEYIPTNCLRTKDLHNKEISAQIARKLAVIHNLDMPLCKEPRFLKELIEHWLKEIPNMVELAKYNLHAELQWLLEKLAALKSPVVFSHNDLQEGNLLFFKNCPHPEKQLTVIDLEYSSYNYRGFDFGNHFCEWCFDYQSVKEMPCYSYDEESYPSESQQKDFFRAYLKAQKNEPCTEDDEFDRLYEVTYDCLYKETNTGALASHLMWGVWSVIQKDKSDIQFGYMDYAITRFESYIKLKKKLFPDEKSQSKDSREK